MVITPYLRHSASSIDQTTRSTQWSFTHSASGMRLLLMFVTWISLLD